jgi:hypothetical protein
MKSFIGTIPSFTQFIVDIYSSIPLLGLYIGGPERQKQKRILNISKFTFGLVTKG